MPKGLSVEDFRCGDFSVISLIIELMSVVVSLVKWNRLRFCNGENCSPLFVIWGFWVIYLFVIGKSGSALLLMRRITDSLFTPRLSKLGWPCIFPVMSFIASDRSSRGMFLVK